jgi:hypothetical protein
MTKAKTKTLAALALLSASLNANAENSAVGLALDALTQADQAIGDFVVVAPYIPEAVSNQLSQYAAAIPYVPEAIGNRVATAREAAIDWEVACRPARFDWANGIKETLVTPLQLGIDMPAECAARYGDQVNQWRTNSMQEQNHE